MNERTLSDLGERLRRVALGLTAALITARAFWPSEPNLKEGAGAGLLWVLLVLVTAGIALAVPLLGGRLRFRWSATDALVVALMTLVAMSATHALDRRPAINLAWEWVGLGFVYLLLRNLPRTRNESSILAAALVATAVAVSAYGLYQVKVELPLLQARFERHPGQFLEKLNIEPGTRGELMLRNRLMYSSEPWATFALANSLAGFIAGPLVMLLAIGLYNVVRQDAPGSRWTVLAMGAPLLLVLLVCLILSKSRSAYLGVLVGVCLLAWHARRDVRARVLLTVGLAGAVVVVGLVIAGVAAGTLDREVLTQSPKSLRYRWEYWRGAWGVITEGSPTVVSALAAPTFWWGVGPGNFGGPYLKYKLPESSEEIIDPHNLLLEIWATGGFWALLCLLAALAWGLWNVLGPPSRMSARREVDYSSWRRARRGGRSIGRDGAGPLSEDQQDDLPPAGTGWLMISAGAGWAAVVVFGWLNPFQADLFSRWLILGAGWLGAALLGAGLWKRLPVPALALGAAGVAMVVNLLGAGGIGIPTVALGFWSILALGLNLRDDRSCSRLREYDSRMPALGLAVAWSALVGTFIGLVGPFWRCEAAIAQAEAAINQVPPNYDGADEAYKSAIKADGYNVRPWLNRASLYWMVWRERGSKVEDLRWKTIPFLYKRATTAPRNPEAWSLHAERARAIQRLMNVVGARLDARESLRYRGEIVEATRTAARLNPTSAELHARLAEASAELSVFKDAATEGAEALRLDRMTPHADKKLPEALRRHLETMIPRWSESAAKMPMSAAP